MALFEGVAQGALGLGGFVAPALMSVLGLPGALEACGVLLVAVAALLANPLLRHRAALAARSAGVEHLRAVALFEPLSLAVVEELAARAVALEFVPGATLIREGDPGDRYYVIAEGSVAVSRHGRRVADVAAGGGVGEIALMRNVPRTATVVALDAVSALAINGPDFLAAITGHPGSLQAAVRIGDARLEELARS
jgi:CRP-like cAMP-binding protein